MADEVPIPNESPTPGELAAFSRLSLGEVEAFDDAILSCVLIRWQKVAMIASLARKKLEPQYPEFSFSFYGERIRLLAGQGRLESQGNLSYMRFSEVRLPQR